MSQTVEMLNISGKEAKKHIAEALKIVFPGVKFSMRSSYDSVYVTWTDGPLTIEVERVLNRFESYTRVLCVTDYKKATGYEWKGQHFLGPEFLSTSRSLSDERKSILFRELETQGSQWGDLNVSERYEVERDLIRRGLLYGVSPRDCPDLLLDSKPVIDNRKKPNISTPEIKPTIEMLRPLDELAGKKLAKVLQFPIQKPVDRLTPVQRLKLKTLQLFIEKEDLTELSFEGADIDQLFEMVAEEICSN
ncbi:LPD29 domain-containing protein [Priestia sp. BR_2]